MSSATFKRYFMATITAGFSCFVSLELFSSDPIRSNPVRNALLASLLMSVIGFVFQVFSIVDSIETKHPLDKTLNRLIFFALTSAAFAPFFSYLFYITSGPISGVFIGTACLFWTSFISCIFGVLGNLDTKRSLPCSRPATTALPPEHPATLSRPFGAATARAEASSETPTRSSATCAEASLPAT